jgi:hypothetical protein
LGKAGMAVAVTAVGELLSQLSAAESAPYSLVAALEAQAHAPVTAVAASTAAGPLALCATAICVISLGIIVWPDSTQPKEQLETGRMSEPPLAVTGTPKKIEFQKGIRVRIENYNGPITSPQFAIGQTVHLSGTAVNSLPPLVIGSELPAAFQFGLPRELLAIVAGDAWENESRHVKVNLHAARDHAAK